jgi:iron complex transport system ATP-binding protein
MKSIVAKNISFSYNEDAVLRNITLEFTEGDFVGIIGPNGAGKSTLLRIICRILRPQHGTILLFGDDIAQMHGKHIARYIAFVPQETHFSLNFTVEDVVRMGRYPYQSPFQPERSEDRDAVDRALNAAEVHKFRHRHVDTLSSGERQRVVIARALAQAPRILILDEPTSHLDLRHQHAIMDLLGSLNSKGMSILVVNHDLNLASLYCRRLILLHEGSVFAQGTPVSIITEEILKQIYHTDVTIIRHPQKNVPQIFMQ